MPAPPCRGGDARGRRGGHGRLPRWAKQDGDLKILFMTGYAESAARASEFLRPGMELVSKPTALDTLAARLRRILSSSLAI